jgi:hypothetical protein
LTKAELLALLAHERLLYLQVLLFGARWLLMTAVSATVGAKVVSFPLLLSKAVSFPLLLSKAVSFPLLLSKAVSLRRLTMALLLSLPLQMRLLPFLLPQKLLPQLPTQQ